MNPFKNLFQNNRKKIDIAFGGYYTHLEKGTWRLFRLLDFNVDSIHYQIFTETFDRKPTIEQAAELRPKIQHVPQQAARILRDEKLELIGVQPLTPDDLSGYSWYYQDAEGFSSEQIKERVERVIAISKDPPMRLELSRREDGGVNVHNPR